MESCSLGSSQKRLILARQTRKQLSSFSKPLNKVSENSREPQKAKKNTAVFSVNLAHLSFQEHTSNSATSRANFY